MERAKRISTSGICSNGKQEAFLVWSPLLAGSSLVKQGIIDKLRHQKNNLSESVIILFSDLPTHFSIDRISMFYERVFPALMKELSERFPDCELDPKLLQRIQFARSSLLITFRAILHHKCFSPLTEDMYV